MKKQPPKTSSRDEQRYTNIILEQMRDQIQLIAEGQISLRDELIQKIDANHRELKQDIQWTQQGLKVTQNGLLEVKTEMQEFKNEVKELSKKMDYFGTLTIQNTEDIKLLKTAV